MGHAGSPFVNQGRVAMSVKRPVEHFSALEDPQCAGKVDHRLVDILVIAAGAMHETTKILSWKKISQTGLLVPKTGPQSFMHYPCGILEDPARATAASLRDGALHRTLSQVGPH
jgi:hypothetical protein